MKLHTFAVLFVLFALTVPSIAQPLPTASPESVGMSSERLNLIEGALQKEIEQDRMPGAVVMIARRGELVYYEALGYLDKSAGIAMPKDAIFSIASMTKPIFTVAAMSLYEEGRLLINEPVGNYLPELEGRRVAVNDDCSMTEAAIRQPTLEDLMRHTSGFMDPLYGDNAHRALCSGSLVAEPRSEEDYFEILEELPLRYQPGTTWEYGPGFDMLGLAIERITGQPIYEFLSERLFVPLGMNDTSFAITASESARQAKLLALDPITGAAQTTRVLTEPRAIDCGSGCLASTAEDYLAFAQMLLNGGTLNGTRVLGPKTVEYMTSDHTGPDIDMTRLYQMSVSAYGYGFGLGVAVRRGAGLGGKPGSPGEYFWVGSQGTIFWIDPLEELVVVYMAQTPGPIRGYYRQLVPALVYQAIVE